MDKDVTKRIGQIRAACLANAKELIAAAKLIPQSNIRFHLAILALEEIGKMALATVELSINKPNRPQVNPGTDDHIKKLFWSLWGASFEKENITKEGIDLYRGLATNLHNKRLEAVYVDLSSSKLPSQAIDKKEADNLVGLVEARIGMEEQYKIRQYDPEDEKIFSWFLDANDDPEKRKYILGTTSLNKLQEFQSSNKWVKWLYEEFRKSDEEGKLLLESELKRDKPQGPAADKPKWKIKLKFYSESHSIRPSVFKKWNEQVDWIKLHGTNQKVFTKRPDEIICEITLPSGVHVAGIWPVGWGIARQLVTSFNIVTKGLFWWYLPVHKARFYEEITDLELNSKVGAERNPKLEIDWASQNFVLSEKDLANVSKVFGYLHKKKDAKSLQHYTTAISLLAKNDIHLELWQQALIEFYSAMKELLIEQGGKGTKEEVVSHYGKYLTKTDNLERIVNEIEALERTGKPLGDISLTDVVALKWGCDLYFEELTNSYFLKAKEKEAGPENRKGNEKQEKPRQSRTQS